MLVLYTIFFILLQPGMVFNATSLARGYSSDSTKTSVLDILIHSVLFFTINKLIATNTIGFGFFLDIQKQITG
jgi:hypothetical protein